MSIKIEILESNNSLVVEPKVTNIVADVSIPPVVSTLITTTPYNGISATNLQNALEEIADDLQLKLEVEDLTPYATKTFVNNEVSQLVGGSPETLDTLNELASALGDDPNFATTIANTIGEKVSKSGDTISGNLAFGDFNAISFGDIAALRIYHDGDNSLIRNTTGSLYIQDDNGSVFIRPKSGQNGIVSAADGATTLYYSGSEKFKTSNAGVQFTGDLFIASSANIRFDNQLALKKTTNGEFDFFGGTNNTLGGFNFRTWNGSTYESSFTIRNNGNVGIGSTNPEKLLHLHNDTSSELVFSTADTFKAGFKLEGNDLDLISYNSIFGIHRNPLNINVNTGNATFNGEATSILSSTIQLGPTYRVHSIENDFSIVHTQNSFKGFRLLGNVPEDTLLLNSSGNVGIGTPSPTARLHVLQETAGADMLALEDGGYNQYLRISVADSAKRISFVGGSASSAFSFHAGSTELARIDNQRNLLVGKTTSSYSNIGTELRPDGRIVATASSSLTAAFIRQGTDGPLQEFRKNTNIAGVLGVVSNDNLYLQGSTNHGGIAFGTNSVVPFSNYSYVDGGISLGSATARFQDLHLSGSVNANDAVLENVTFSTSGIEIESSSSDTLSFSGTAGQLFSISDSMAGTIFSVNDVSGIPSIEVEDSGVIRLAEYSGNILAGTNVDNNTDKVQVEGSLSLNVASDLNIVTFTRSGTTVGSISVTTTTTSYNTSSDERLKENIEDASEDTGIDKLKVRQFDWKETGEHARFGFVAQEVEEVYPEAVHTDQSDMKSVDYSKLVPLLVKEIQELRKEIDLLKQ